jgi:hypothetical protein
MQALRHERQIKVAASRAAIKTAAKRQSSPINLTLSQFFITLNYVRLFNTA